jgi:hypothetical protein
MFWVDGGLGILVCVCVGGFWVDEFFELILSDGNDRGKGKGDDWGYLFLLLVEGPARAAPALQCECCACMYNLCERMRMTKAGKLFAFCGSFLMAGLCAFRPQAPELL